MSLTTTPTSGLDSAAFASAGAGTGPVVSTSSALANAGSSKSVEPLSKDIAALLQDLAAGDVGKASADLLKLQEDLKAQEPPPSNVGALNSLYSNVADSLQTGDTKQALSKLTSHLVEAGQSAGAVLNTSA